MPEDSKNKEELIMNSHLAMANSRAHSDTGFMVFDEEMGRKSYQKNRIGLKLKKLKFDEELYLNFQSQYSFDVNSIEAFEVLLRWKTPTGEVIPPGELLFQLLKKQARLLALETG